MSMLPEPPAPILLLGIGGVGGQQPGIVAPVKTASTKFVQLRPRMM
jgi:hypothetical protein